VFDDYLKEIAQLGALPKDEEDQKQVKSAAIRQGKRRYFVDLRENTRGRFVKVTWLVSVCMFVDIVCMNTLVIISTLMLHTCVCIMLIFTISACTRFTSSSSLPLCGGIMYVSTQCLPAKLWKTG